MTKSALTRDAIAVALFAALACTVAGCASDGGGGGYYGGYGAAPYDYGYGATQSSTCGATGTCPPSNFPRVGPGDRNYGG
jgi:hypothetical protein